MDHVAVDGDRALPELPEFDDRAERPADEALDLVGPPTGATGLAGRAGRRCTGQHPILRGDPTLPRASEERWHALLDRRRTDHPRLTDLDEHRPLRVPEVVPREADRPERLGAAPVPPDHRRVTTPARCS